MISPINLWNLQKTKLFLFIVKHWIDIEHDLRCRTHISYPMEILVQINFLARKLYYKIWGHILTTKIGRRLKSASTGQVDLATGLNFKISHMTKFIPPLCRTSQGDKKSYFICINWTLNVNDMKFGEIHILNQTGRAGWTHWSDRLR
jgi:hypothetical protein